MLKGAFAPAFHRGVPILGVTRKGTPVLPIAGGDGSTESDIDQFDTVETLEARKAEVKTDLTDLANEFRGKSFDADAQARWDVLNAEHDAIVERVAELREREDRLAKLAEDEDRTVPGDGAKPSRFDRKPSVAVRTVPENIYDLTQYRQAARSPEDEARLMRDGAMRSIESSVFPAHVRKEDVQTHIGNLLDTIDQPGEDKVPGELARRILTTGSPAYKRAFGKYLKGQGMTPEEQRALSVGTGSAGGFGVVYTLDPTVVPTSNFSVNPFRAIARIETISGTNEWKAVTSGAITAAYAAEATEASDNAPTLAQPDIIVEKAQAYVPFSIELGQDWNQLQSEMGSLLQDAKDDLEATKFALGAGHGSTEPKGIITGATNTVAPAGGVGTFAIADLYKLLEALAPRFRPRARWLANLFTYDKARQFDTAGGSGVWYGPGQNGLQAGSGGMVVGTADGSVGTLLGRPAHESTAMDAALTTTKKILVIGDFRYFCIVDRVGMNVEVVPLVVGTNHRPTGQRGLYAYWRNSSDVLSAAAFQVLTEP